LRSRRSPQSDARPVRGASALPVPLAVRACRDNAALPVTPLRSLVWARGLTPLHRQQLLFPLFGLARFLHFEHFTALIVTAFWASAMWLLPFVTIWTLGRRGRGQIIVGAAARRARFGMPPFGIWHGKSPGDAAWAAALCFRSSKLADQIVLDFSVLSDQ